MKALLLLFSGLAAATFAPASPVYGNLKQSDIPGCGAVACGPVAAVNSFVYLQTKYPDIYGASLVGLVGDQPPPLHWEILAADLLGGAGYMGSCCSAGTPLEKFITGKQSYIEDRIPGKTEYKAQIDIPWRPETAGSPGHPIDKPGYVQDSQSPTLAFLRQEIMDGEDVELFLAGSGGNHYVTLTSVGPPEDGVGDMNFVDPITGQMLAENGTYQIVRSGFSSHLEVTYDDPGTKREITVVIAGAVSESPTPEPSTFALAALALIGGEAWRRRRQRG
jgi:MYXO-CTERM domain-containing protein